MSKLNINRNIFLEKEELIRFQNFLNNNTAQQAVLDNTTNWGIVRTVFEGDSPDFLLEVGTNQGTVKIANLSKAVDIDKFLIKQVPIDNIQLPNTGSILWAKISHQYTNLEVGTCDINIAGEVSGIGTKFTEVIRGQNTEVPVKIKFYKQSGTLSNDGIYEVVEVNGDTDITLVGSSFIAENGLNYIVIGSTPIGETITSQQQDGLYLYDSCKIEFVPEVVENTAPAGLIENKEFYIARITNTGGVVTIEDKREEFLTFNVEGINEKLQKDPSLWQFTAGEIEYIRTLFGINNIPVIYDSGWKNMTRSTGVMSDNFDLKIRRYGNVVNIVGTVRSKDGGVVDEKIAYIPLANIGGQSSAPTTRIYFQSSQVAGVEINRGLRGYVKVPVVRSNTFNELGLYIQDCYQDADLSINITYICG